MKVRKHFRTNISTIEYIISDLSFNHINNKDIYFRYCVNSRISKLNLEYDNKLNRILTYLIKNCSYGSLPLCLLTRIVVSVSKITNALSRGFISLIS